ncbi:MAG: PepSY-associated TM helix domain-containing protein [Gammaproteobacteria bacterium]
MATALRGRLSIWISDFAGIAIVVLALTGLLQWWLPRRWRRHKQSLSTGNRRSVYRWLFRGHGPVIGLLAIIPIVFLSLTGIFFDHPRALMRMMNDVSLSSSVLPTAFRPKDLAGEIRALTIDPDGSWSVMTRLGLLHSKDKGSTWSFDYQAPLLSHLKGGLVGMSQHDGVMFLGTHGGPNFHRRSGIEPWQAIPSLRMMIQDAQLIGDIWYMKGSGGFIRGTLDGRFTPLDTNLPDVSGMPVYNFLVDLHTGLMFHENWIWINDIAALIAVVLTISGLVNWLYRRWI